MLQEREFEIKACVDVLNASLIGRGACVVLRGGAGTGKSEFLEHMAGEAHGRGMISVRFRGNHADHEFELGLVTHLMQSVWEELGDEVRESFDEVMEPDVAAVIRGAGLHPDWPPSRRSHVLRGLVHLLGRVMGLMPQQALFIAIDNLHWVDRTSLLWLSAVLDRLHSWPVLIVASVCDGVGGTDADVLDDVVDAADHHFTLRNLSSDGASAMLRRHLGQELDPAFARAVEYVTGGNPSLLEALLHAVAEGQVTPDANGAHQLAEFGTDSLALSVRVRLRRVSPQAMQVFRIAAVFGRDATVQSIANLSGLETSDVADSCHSMGRLGVLDVDGDRVSVAYPMLANSVLRDASPTALKEVHAEAAALLHGSGAPPRRIAAHLLLGGNVSGTPWAVATLREAALDSVAVNDTAAAIRYLRRALEEPLGPDLRAAVLTDLASATSLSAVDESARIIRQAAHLDPGVVAERASEELLLVLALGEHQEEARLIRTSAPRRRSDAFVSGALLLNVLNVFNLPMPDVASDGSGASGPEDTRPLHLASRALSITRHAVSRKEAIELAKRAVAGAGHSVTGLVVQLGGAHVLALSGDTETAMGLCDTTIRAAEAGELWPVLAVALLVRSRLALQLGRVRTAADDGRRGLQLVLNSGFAPSASLRVAAVAQVASVLTESGDTDEAFALLGEVAPLGDEKGTRSAVLLHARGRLRLLTKDPEAGLRDLQACGDLLLADGIANPAVCAWRSHAAEGLALLGRPEDAERLLEQELDLARAWGAPAAVAGALLVRAKLREPVAASSELAEATRLLRPCGQHLLLAKVLYQHGSAVGDRDLPTARKSLREAYELAIGFGMDEFSSRIRSALTGLGGRPPRLRGTGIDSLTDSERRVAVLAVQGRKNREIAAALFVQVRTVEIHLTNAYRKLGIGGRQALEEALLPAVAG
ncbi:AAA family ATPase [Streptomyces sp. NPDC086010]|uniref:helix-turn-helix transcriptional regulator n=1 Tax=Streptomyces sp. NPDC086010 TaxID=3365745 RepID=UPI0037D9145B